MAQSAKSTRKKQTPPQTPPASDPMHRQVCSRIKQLRASRKWTLEQLSSLCGVSRSMLSQIERGGANPTLGVTFRIAQAFGISLAELVDEPTGASKIDVVRCDDDAALFRSDELIRIRTLSPLHTEKDVEFYEILLRAKGKLESGAHFEGTTELLTVEKGHVVVTSGDGKTDLHKGDSAQYPADVPHSISNAGRGDAIVYLVVIYQSRSGR